MSYEVWGDPPDEHPIACQLCDNPLGSSTDCQCCQQADRASNAELELMQLRQTLRHRLRILKTRNVYEGAKKGNGVSVELLQAMTLLFGIKGVLHPHEVEPAMVAEAETALLTWENGKHIYSDQPGCNCHYHDKPHPSIHAETCPYRIRFAAAWGMKGSTGTAGAHSGTPAATATDEGANRA